MSRHSRKRFLRAIPIQKARSKALGVGNSSWEHPGFELRDSYVSRFPRFGCASTSSQMRSWLEAFVQHPHALPNDPGPVDERISLTLSLNTVHDVAALAGSSPGWLCGVSPLSIQAHPTRVGDCALHVLYNGGRRAAISGRGHPNQYELS